MWEPFEETFMALETQFRDSIIVASRTAGITEMQRVHLKDDGENYSGMSGSCFLTRRRSGEKGSTLVALGHRFR